MNELLQELQYVGVPSALYPECIQTHLVSHFLHMLLFVICFLLIYFTCHGDLVCHDSVLLTYLFPFLVTFFQFASTLSTISVPLVYVFLISGYLFLN